MIQTRALSRTPFNRARAVDQTPPAITETVRRMARFMLNRAKADVPTSEQDLLRQGFSARQIRQYGHTATDLAQQEAARSGVYKPTDTPDRVTHDPETNELAE